MLHKNLPPTQNHVPHAFEFDNAAERESATFSDSDIGKVALQKDNWSSWVLQSSSPAVWVRVSTFYADPPFELIYQTEAVDFLSVAPDGEVFNAIVDLAPYGLVVDQKTVQLDAVLTKPGPNGTRVSVTTGGGDYERGIGIISPAAPYPGDLAYNEGVPGIGVAAVPLMNATEGYPAVLTVAGIPADMGMYRSVVGVETGDHGASNRCRYVRFYVRRDSHAYTPEELARFAGWKLHFNVTAPNNVVREWVYDVPAAPSVTIVDEPIDLREIVGSASWIEEFCLIAELRRDGKVIRGFHAPQAYEGEAYDPPTYPVCVRASGYVDTPVDDYRWNPNNTNDFPQGFIYGDDPGSLQWWFTSDVLVASLPAMCTGPMRTKVRIQAWRTTSTGDTEYQPGPGLATVPVPAGAMDGCKLHIKLLRGGRQQRALYPFQPDDARPAAPAQTVLMQSSNGTKYALTVSDSGTLVVTPA